MIGQEAFCGEFITAFMTKLFSNAKTITDFYTFNGINRHHGMRDVSIQTIKDWLAPTHWHFRCNDLEFSATTGALLTQRRHQRFKTWYYIHIATEKRIIWNFIPVQFLCFFSTNLSHMATNLNTKFLKKEFLSNCTRCDTHCRFTGT